MSNWTHVAGIMRVDAIRPLGGKYNFTEILGKELHFDSSSSLWDEAEENPEKFLPMGREDSERDINCYWSDNYMEDKNGTT